MAEFPLDKSYLQKLTGKVAIITGASSGIGLATVKEFAKAGAHVVAADLNPLPESIPEVVFRKTDLTKWEEQVELFELAITKFGRIDIAFLNAGVYELEPLFTDTYDEQGRLKEPTYKVLQVNLIAPIAGTKLAIHHMRKQPEGGAIVITGSGKCFTGIGGTPMYATAKHGLLGMVRSLSYDLHTLNLRINLMCPFWTATGIVPQEVLETSASAKRSMQPPINCTYAVAHLGLDPACQGKIVYVAEGTYTDIDVGLMKTRPQWMGKNNHEGRLVWEEDPSTADNRTPL